MFHKNYKQNYYLPIKLVEKYSSYSFFFSIYFDKDKLKSEVYIYKIVVNKAINYVIMLILYNKQSII